MNGLFRWSHWTGFAVALLLSGVSSAGSSPALSRGTWVYKIDGKPLMEVEPGAKRLLAFARAHQLTEIYLSVGAAPLDDPRTPALLRTLKEAGLRVEALIDNPKLERAIERVVAFNRKHPASEQFDGVHYDFEPWINAGDRNTGWFQELVTQYRLGRRATHKARMSFSADMSGSKFINLEPERQETMLEAAGRLVLMMYEARADAVVRRQAKLSKQLTGRGELMLATQVTDFGACEDRKALKAVDSGYSKLANYRGWATYAYHLYLDPTVCPAESECCQPSHRRPSAQGRSDSRGSTTRE